ncbi:hypothetical protein C2S51_023357 [Perilla frutescens var. frutescens]|nr:hypothetical protein C2S51_023357 [Perilla frutescens var. frutescens]
MEVAIIDWKTIDSRVVVDDLYEHINAPKWVDFSAPNDPVDDEAWFCRPVLDCKFYSLMHSYSCLIQAELIHNCRDATLKKRGTNQPLVLSNQDTKYYRVVEDDENQDPNFSTPQQHKAKVGKGGLKSSADRKQASDANERIPKLRSTLSARNLFSGGDLLSKVSEFCNELKKLAMRAQDKESADNVEKQAARDHVHENGGILNDREKERKPLLEQSKEKSEVVETSSYKGKLRRKKRNDDSENTPISVDVKCIKHLEAEGKLPIRTCPPTPQCFSAGFGNSKSTTPKPFRARPLNQERGILQELKQIEKDVTKVEKKSNHGGGGEVTEKEARSLDVFWFLKPCTLSN